MAKNGHVEKSGGGPLNIDVETGPKKVFSVEAKKAMFGDYSKAHDRTLAAQKAAEDAKDAEGEFVKIIMESLGNGPFSYKGQVLTAIMRQNKDGSRTYFFKRPSDADLQEIG